MLSFVQWTNVILVAPLLLAVLAQHEQPIPQRALSIAHNSWDRYLQTPCNIQTDQGCSTNPDAVCEFYNGDNSSSVGNCECERFGTLDTSITCSFRDDCFNATASCFVGTVERILNPTLEARTVETCVRFPESDNPSATTCIRTFPTEVGSFDTLESCVVRYTGTGEDPRLCQSCSICPGTPGGGSSGVETMPEISFDCCNLVPDLKQTCQPVTTEGVGIPNFDPVIEPGTCVSGATHIAMQQSSVAVVSAIVVLVMAMQWI